MPLVNDIHSALNETQVRRIVAAGSTDAVVRAVREARREGIAVSVMGGRHAMGAQQFGTDTLLVDTRPLSRILGFDPERGLVEAEAGILWPALLDGYQALQNGAHRSWGIAQKQTGADRLSVGGTLGANGHGRGLTLPPFVADVEAFTLVDGAGEVLQCSRTENAELFSLVAGGYGLFGVVTAVTLRLMPRRKLERVVEVRRRDGLAAAFEERIRDGFLYGDFQFSIDRSSDGFLDESTGRTRTSSPRTSTAITPTWTRGAAHPAARRRSSPRSTSPGRGWPISSPRRRRISGATRWRSSTGPSA